MFKMLACSLFIGMLSVTVAYAGPCGDACNDLMEEDVVLCEGDQDCIDVAKDSKDYCKFCCKNFCPVCGDVNRDGVANVIDAMFIAQASVGMIPPESLQCR